MTAPDVTALPGRLTGEFQPGNEFVLSILWPVEVARDRTFTAFLGVDALTVGTLDESVVITEPVEIAGTWDVLPVTFSAAVTAAHPRSEVRFGLLEGTQELIVGPWTPDTGGAVSPAASAAVAMLGDAIVAVTLLSLPSEGGGEGGQVDQVVAGPGVSVDSTDPTAPVVTAEVTQAELDTEAGARAAADTAVGLAAAADATTKANAAQAAAVQRANHTGSQTSTTISDFTEAVQDAVALLLGAGSNITLNYDDNANTLTVSSADTTDAEAVRDAIGIALLGVGVISVAVNDGADTITISSTATVNATDAALRDRSTHTGTQLAVTISDFAAAALAATSATYVPQATFAEQVQDLVGAMATDSATVNFTYDDTAGTLTAVVQGLAAADISDFAEAVRDRLGSTLVAGTGITVTVDDPGDTVTIATTITQYTDEMARDAIGAALAAGANVTVTVNDGADTITVAVPTEGVQDIVGALLTAGTGITVTYDDAGNTLTIATTITQYTDEMARDALGTALTAGTGITITPNDGADTITIATTITQYTDEMARDALGTALVAGSGITITPNDGADTITIAATGGGGSANLATIYAFGG